MHHFINIGTKAARAAGDIILRGLRQSGDLKLSVKTGQHDLVSNIDMQAEAKIIDIILKAYPEHNIQGEESGIQKGDSEVTWIIDPLDGTFNFIHGFPYFAVSIAVMRKDVIEHGIIYNPVTDELFLATKGEGAQLNGKRLRMVNCHNFNQALIATGFAYKRTDYPIRKIMQTFTSVLEQAADIRRPGACALDLANLAAGRLDGFWEVGVQPWDIAAGVLMIKEAGGYVSDFQGEPNFLQSNQIVAGSRKVFPRLLQIVQKHL